MVETNKKMQEIESKVLDNLMNNQISVIKLLMAESIKVNVDKFIMESESPYNLPDRYF